MINHLSSYFTRRSWAHLNACLDFGHRHTSIKGWFARRAKYDRLFREYMRIGKLMQLHGHQLI